MTRNALIALTACLLVAADEPPQAKKDAPFEPRSTPGAGQKLLERFAGEWEVAKAFYPRTGEPVRAQGRCRQAMIHDGRFLQSEFVFEAGGKKTSGLGIIGFEPENGTFTSFWTDSRQTRMSVRRSREPFDGNQIVLYSQALDGETKDGRRSKTVSRLEADGRKLVHQQFSLGPNGEERLVMELVMTRIAPAQPPAN